MRLSNLPLLAKKAGEPDTRLFRDDEVTEIMRDTYRQGDRIMVCAIVVHTLLALCFAPAYQTWNVTFLVGGAAALLFFVSVWLMPGRFITRCIAGLSLQMFTALHIYQYHGLPEMHFFFFTAFTLMIFYQDWRSMWPGTLAIIGQHILFAVWTNAGRNLYFFPGQEVPVEALKLTYHFGIALSQVGIAGVCARALQQKRLRHAWQERKLRESGRLLEEHLQRVQDSEALLQAQTRELVVTRQRLEDDIKQRQEIETQRAQLYTIVEAARNHAENQAQLLRLQAVELQQVRDAALASTTAKSQFLANMSHEIRTPMNGVLGMMELLKGTALQPHQQDYVNTARSSAENLLSVLNDILDFSKIEAGKLSLENIPFSLRELMEEVVEMFALRAHSQGLELLCLIPEGLPEILIGDPGRLRQILVNLLANAFKFTVEGEIALQAEVVRCSEHYATVRILVRDTGIGISEERQQCIFDSFTQADGSTTRKYGGTGLGLSISRQLTHLMRGEIGLDSVQGVGSVFWVVLSLPVAALKHKSAFALSSAVRGSRILIVDDNVTNRRILSEQLLSWGCAPDTAESGEEALRKIRSAQSSQPYQLALVDMQMPELDGEQVARMIRSDSRLDGLPLIALSPVGRHNEADEIRQKCFDASLNKPVRQSHLYNALVKLIDMSESDVDSAVESQAVLCEPALSLDVLLAEDNPVNQKFALHLLETWDCHVTVVTNGREALEAVSQQHYSLVLMDLQMPQIDGLEVVSRLRERERAAQRDSEHAVPEHLVVIAMTAHAMEGDRQRCLSAGMDDYVAKPFSRLELYEVLSKWGNGDSRAFRSIETDSSSPSVELDWERLRAKCGYDETFVCELIEEFLRQTPVRLDRIQSAMAREDLSSVLHEAHTLRGGCLTLEATEMAALSDKLEKAGKEKSLAACRKQIPPVLFASEKLNIMLEQYLSQVTVRR